MHPRTVARYGVAIAAPAAGLAACLLLERTVGTAPIGVFILPIIVAAWFGGTGPGLVATFLGTTAGGLVLAEGAVLTAPTPINLVRVLIVIVTGSVISVLFGALNRSRATLLEYGREGERRVTQLGAEQQRLHALFEHIPAGVVVADVGGRIVLENQQAIDLLGHSAMNVTDVGGYASLRGMDADGRPLQAGNYPLPRALRGETLTKVEYRYTRPDGTDVWLRASAAPITNGDAVTGAVVLFWNIDLEKQYEAALLSSNAALRATEDRLDLALTAGRMGTWHIACRQAF